jgi:hypothetical protein
MREYEEKLAVLVRELEIHDNGRGQGKYIILHLILSFSHHHLLPFLFAKMRLSGEIWILIGLESDLESMQADSMVGRTTPSVADPND